MRIKIKMVENNICSVCLTDLHFSEPQKTEKCLEIIKHFTKGDTYFWGLYREDGNFIDYNDTLKFRTAIPKYFEDSGKFINISSKKLILNNKNSFDKRISAIGSLNTSEDTYKMIPNICNYYLETVFFEPLKSWNDFELLYSSNPMQNATCFIKSCFTDMAFLHVDSGTFIIEFNTDKLDYEIIISYLKNF